jgi:SAM-dependent methyltransferase
MAIGALGEFYGQMIAPGSQVLDLMSSWVSHLPDELELGGLTGLGMNAYELGQNRRLTERVVQDLNKEPVLPFANATFDAGLISVSVQYLTQPVEVFREVGRVLKPGGRLAVAYSNRLFPTRRWPSGARWATDHAELIGLYFRRRARSRMPT